MNNGRIQFQRALYLLRACADQPKFHMYRYVGNFSVSLCELVRRKRRAAARAPRQDLVRFLEELAFVKLTENPPQRFDVFWFVGNIGMLEIKPVADALGQKFPF